MRAIDGVGALNPALTNLAFVKETETSTRVANRLEPVSSTTKSYASATGDGRSSHLDVSVFKPVVGPSQSTESNLPTTMKSAEGSLDVLL